MIWFILQDALLGLGVFMFVIGIRPYFERLLCR